MKNIGKIFPVLTVIWILILLFTRRFLNISFGFLIWFILSYAFFMLYYNKKATWGLILAVYSMFIGFSRGLSIIFNTNFPLINSGMFFIAPGLLFVIKDFNSTKQRMVPFGTALIWFGLYIILSGFNFNSFLFCLGFYFISIYVLKKNQKNNFTICFGVILTIIAVWDLFFRISPFIVICAAIALIIKYIAEKEKQ